MQLEVSSEASTSPLAELLNSPDAFDRIMNLEGRVFRDVAGRKTLQFHWGERSYFAKLHQGVGWAEILKNLASFQWPVLGAKTEWRAIQRLEALGVFTTTGLAYGCRGINPARQQSFLITADLGDIVSLEDFCRDWAGEPPPLSLKRAILGEVARIASVIHERGLQHRDFYICHLCLDRTQLNLGKIHMYLIDLHRMRQRLLSPQTGRMKDMAALFFSALDIGLSRRDCLRFLRLYHQKPLRVIFSEDAGFWKRVDVRARKLFYKFHRRWPVTPFDARR